MSLRSYQIAEPQFTDKSAEREHRRLVEHLNEMLAAISPSGSGPVTAIVTSGGGTETGSVSITTTKIGAVPTARTLTAGTGLTGGGDLSANRTIAVTGILATFSALASGAGWLHNDGAGTLAYSTPSKADVGLGNVEDTALSTWAGSANITTLGTVVTGSFPAANLTGTTLAANVVASSLTSVGAECVMTTPKVTTGIKDANGNTILALTAGVTPVNYVTLANSATTVNPSLTVSGSDAIRGLDIIGKGSGTAVPLRIRVDDGAGNVDTVAQFTVNGTRVANTARTLNFNAAGSGSSDYVISVNTISLGLRVTSGQVVKVGSVSDGTTSFAVTALTSAANYISVAAGTTGNAPSLSATGGDTNIALTLIPKASHLAVTPTAASAGARSLAVFTGAAHTGQTASTEVIDFNVNLARTVTWAAGAITTQRAMVVQAPTYAFASASTITTASTLAITGAPAAGTNATITNAYALHIAAGSTYLGGNLIAAAGLAYGRTAVAAATATLTNASASLVGCTYTATGTVGITLPAANAVPAGRVFVIVDEGNNAAANNITVSRAGSDTFGDGSTSQVITTNLGVLRLYSDGTSKWFVY